MRVGRLDEQKRCRIGVVAPASRMSPEVAERVPTLARSLYPDRTPEIILAHVGLSSGRLRQPTHDRFNHAAGTVTARANLPHRNDDSTTRYGPRAAFRFRTQG